MTDKVQLMIPCERTGQGSTFVPLETTAPLAGARMNNDGAAIFVIPVADAGGFLQTPLLLADDADGVAVINQNRYEGSVVRLTGYNEAGNVWDRLRQLNTDEDGVPAVIPGALVVLATPSLFNGVTFDRQRINSADSMGQQVQPHCAMVASPGEWAVSNEGAVSAQATATRAAGAAGVRHVCRSLAFSLAAVAAQTIVYARIRDGASGAGAILWSMGITVPAGGNFNFALSGLNLIGTAATAMTFEFSAAPVATNFQTVAGSGYSTV